MKLNLGCGHDYTDNWVNVDFYDDSKCDVIHDLEEFPWPWEDNSISEILIKHTLEHLGADWKVYVKILQELYRICEDDATIQVHVPSPWHMDFTGDPSHVRPIIPEGLRLFSKAYCQWCIDVGAANTPFALLYDIDLREYHVVQICDPFWWEKLENGEISESELSEFHYMYRNVVKEFRISLAVVKSKESDEKYPWRPQLDK